MTATKSFLLIVGCLLYVGIVGVRAVAGIYLERGEARYWEGDYDGAIRAFRSAEYFALPPITGVGGFSLLSHSTLNSLWM